MSNNTKPNPDTNPDTTPAAAPDTTPAAVNPAPAKPERVPYRVPRGEARDEQMKFVSVNGKAYWLPKGETSEVPPEVAAELERAEKAESLQDKNKKKLIERSKASQK